MKAAGLCAALTVLLLSACATIDYRIRVDLLGDPALVSAATRTIVVTPATRAVNVTAGEIVKFVAGDKSFAWNFDGAGVVSAFELNIAAPPGMFDHTVMAYVAPNPMYSGDGGGGHGGHGGGHGGGGHR